jgi:hypothetical protein
MAVVYGKGHWTGKGSRVPKEPDSRITSKDGTVLIEMVFKGIRITVQDGDGNSAGRIVPLADFKEMIFDTWGRIQRLEHVGYWDRNAV